MNIENNLKHATAGTGTASQFSGLWTNELSSRMTINQIGNDLTGLYESSVSAEGQATKGELKGFVDGKIASFVVHWDEFQAITAWVGELDEKNSLKTLWQMVKTTKESEAWTSVNAGADSFTKVK